MTGSRQHDTARSSLSVSGFVAPATEPQSAHRGGNEEHLLGIAVQLVSCICLLRRQISHLLRAYHRILSSAFWVRGQFTHVMTSFSRDCWRRNLVSCTTSDNLGRAAHISILSRRPQVTKKTYTYSGTPPKLPRYPRTPSRTSRVPHARRA